MKALVKASAEVGIWLEERPMPTVNRQDILVKIKKTAICGTDMHIYNWDDWAKKTVPISLITGHEFVGEIVEMGTDVEGFSLGQRVSGEGHLTCGTCRNCYAGKRHLCRNTTGVGYDVTGAFAEYFAIPAQNVFAIPDSISDDLASILDPFGNAAHTALMFDCVGEDILITGAGPVGIMAAAIARHIGARNVVVTDVNDYRLTLAKKLGATHTVNAQQTSLTTVMQDLDMREGFDVGMEMSGNPSAFKDLISHMNHGGNVAILGIPPDNTAIDWNEVIFKMLTLQGIYGREIFETWYKMIAMLQSGLDISGVITHHYPIEQFQDGFDTMLSGQSGKVILEW